MRSPATVRNPAAVPGRRCRGRSFATDTYRPSDLLAMFFGAGLLFMLAAAAAAIANAIDGREWLHWLALHLLFLGGISQLVLGAGQFFTCAFLATDPPPRWLIRAQLGAWNLGTVLVAVGVPTATPGLTDGGAVLIAAGLALFAAALGGMERRSLQRAPWALRWYQASAACLGVGALVGVLIANGTAWSHGSLLGAHLALNLGGWLGTAIVGTLHTFFPSLTQTQLRFPRFQLPTYVLWLLGIVAIAGGAAFGGYALVVGGWFGLLLAATLLAVNLIASLRSATRPLALPARLVALAQGFLPVGLLVALAATLDAGVAGPFAGPARPAIATLLLAGWIGLTVSGSLLHLVALLGRVRSFALSMPEPQLLRDRALTVAAGAGVAMLALARAPGLASLRAPAVAVTLAVAGLLAIRVIGLAARAARPGAARATGPRAA